MTKLDVIRNVFRIVIGTAFSLVVVMFLEILWRSFWWRNRW